MRQRFSQKYGFAKVRDKFQVKSMDDALKNRLWNIIKNYLDTLTGYRDPMGITYESDDGKLKNETEKIFISKLYDHFFKTSEEPLTYTKNKIKKDLKNKYYQLKWYEIYDFIEYAAEIYHDKEYSNQFRQEVNKVLEEEMSGYRFVDNYISPIIDEVEIKEVEEALEYIYAPARKHLSNALELLSNRENPDYQNSIKESITAVESVAKIISDKETDLAQCLKHINLGLNKAFKTSMTQLYSWTNKEDGIRHGHTKEELKTSFEEAKYMLVTCSAFVNYLIAKNNKVSSQ